MRRMGLWTHGTEDYDTAGGLTVVDVPTRSEEQSQSVIIADGHIGQMSDGAHAA